MSTVGTFGISDQDKVWSESSVGFRIREIRLEKGMTGGALAKACGVTAAYIYQIESGNMNPSLHIIGKISQVLQIHPRDLFV